MQHQSDDHFRDDPLALAAHSIEPSSADSARRSLPEVSAVGLCHGAGNVRIASDLNLLYS